ncbi:16S rRNA (cytidine(1402)-2'-O)-methyltransferase [Brevibacterium daeguense]|uniref:Ribosomal RNA small subunit methyltransferase I n=1 Tax=Brevibacterium daeguense TaxID=909936 RepID=A0ABP8EG25_9MICO|nr:16S rRNA (cytidine(1402)-2'-O)-methyltransferase [Brevibacterium daeguense]
MTADSGCLVLVGTPIGNIHDASPRMRSEIEAADLIAAEDTRRFLGLADRLGLTHTNRIISLFDHNEQAKAAEIAEAVAAGQRVVLLTDAGMPAVSDPGYRVVREVTGRNLPVTSAPGPSAVFTALALSGLPTDRFTFEGFLPRKAGERARMLGELAHEPRTMVFFESPHRIADTMAAIVESFGADRPMTISRELTKTYEEVLRGTAGELVDAARAGLRGELTLAIAGHSGRATSAADHMAELGRLVDGGMRAKKAAAEIAARHGLSTRDVYEEYLATKE